MTGFQEAEDGSWTINGMGGIKAPVKGSQHYSGSPAQWQATDIKGFWIRPLYEDLERGEKTMLMKVDPGAFAPSHTHEGEFEQVYVLEGSFYDQHRTMKAGDYCCRAPDAPHIAGSEEGATVVLIYTRRDKDGS